MIKCDKGNVCISGSNAMVLAELSTIVHSMYYSALIGEREMNPADAKAEILDAVNYGFMTDDEAKSKARDMCRERLSDLVGSMFKLLEGLGDD